MLTLEELTIDNKKQLDRLEERLGCTFKDPSLLQKGLVHSSFAFEQLDEGQNNETLEFLGDAVLDLTVGILLYNEFPDMNEGELTRMRSALVKEDNLARMAREIGLGDFIMLGRGEETSQGRQKPSILSCTYEAVIGAVFLDSGYDSTLDFVNRQFKPLLVEKKDSMLFSDAKSALQEKIQEKFNQAPTYSVEHEEGPAHDKKFTVSVRFNDKVLGTGTARSKKEAEQQAAAAALVDIESWFHLLENT
ncbi:MAG: ribonuclease III [Proteobacteria bacterium]|nr:ribonuclease III [Pseudomonadota bacterium]